MIAKLQSLQELSPSHRSCAARLFKSCGGEVFPCDAIAFAILDRSLNLLKGFHLLITNGGYISGVGLLRMQLDNVLRFNGIIRSADPHDVANSIINGVQLRTLKDSSGNRMTDRRLVEILAVKNPWITQVYDLASSYVHLSDSHIRHFVLRSKQNESGLRDFAIGDEDGYLSVDHKEALIDAFAVLTRAVLTIVGQWSADRDQHGRNDELKSRFNVTV